MVVRILFTSKPWSDARCVFFVLLYHTVTYVHENNHNMRTVVRSCLWILIAPRRMLVFVDNNVIFALQLNCYGTDWSNNQCANLLVGKRETEGRLLEERRNCSFSFSSWMARCILLHPPTQPLPLLWERRTHYPNWTSCKVIQVVLSVFTLEIIFRWKGCADKF